MKVKYYSEVTKQEYDSEKACLDAEYAAKKAADERQKALAAEQAKKNQLAEERKARAAEVEAARKELVKAQKAYREKLEGFCRTYGTYHWSSNSPDDIPTLFNLFDLF